MTHGPANITLLPIKMTRSSEKASESSSKAHRNRNPPSNNSTTRPGAGVYECLGLLVSLAIAVLHDASPALYTYTSMQPLLSLHEEDITRDFFVVVVGAMMLVVMTALMFFRYNNPSSGIASCGQEVCKTTADSCCIVVWKQPIQAVVGMEEYESSCFIQQVVVGMSHDDAIGERMFCLVATD